MQATGIKITSSSRNIILVIIFAFSFLMGAGKTYAASGSTPAGELDASVATRWMELLYNCVRDEAFTPPVASRVYGYAGVALYESVLPGMKGYKPLTGILRDMPNIPAPDANAVYDWSSSANAALTAVVSGLMPNASDFTRQQIQGLHDKLVEERKQAIPADVVDRSLAYGESVAKIILRWAATDNFDQIHKLTYTVPTKKDGSYWVLPDGKKPVEPNWGALRPMIIPAVAMCDQPLNLAYSWNPDSEFWQQANEVRLTVYNLTNEQQMIAKYWSDGPKDTGTPSGHWVMIETQVAQQLQLKLDKAAEMYAMVGATMNDAFISTWREKYEVMFPRPDAFIRRFINAKWQSFLPTPVFPEYPSGHSTVSGAAAEVLTSLFGNVTFTDRSAITRGFPERGFASFKDAAKEAAISRLYGGIHYRVSIENGLKQGSCIGREALSRLKLHD
jgi:hypothetical protein